MSHHDMTRWIEDADARRFGEAVMFDRRRDIGIGRPHLGGTISKMPAWFQALARVRRPRSRRR